MQRFDLNKNIQRSISRVLAVLAACALMVSLTACFAQPVGTSTNENAAANRQYMAQLNQRTGELSDVLADFQTAVSASDAVGMKAASDRAERIVEGIKKLNPPTSDDSSVATLTSVKDLYVAGLEGLDAAMDDYASLYTQVNSGAVNQAAFERQVKAIQAAYDTAVEKLAAADEELTKLASE